MFWHHLRMVRRTSAPAGFTAPCQTGPMRRLVPWGLLGLVAVAGLVGAGLGIANQPPATSVLSAIAAATRAAGTAHFTYSTVSSSSNAVLRSSTRGSGSIDFNANSVSTVETDTDASFTSNDGSPFQVTVEKNTTSEIWIGDTSYIRLPSFPGDSSPWMKEGRIPLASSGSFGVLGTVSPFALLSGEGSLPRATAVSMGTEILHGMSTTKYRVVMSTDTCPQNTKAPHLSIGPIYLWVDGEGRLVKMRGEIHTTIPKGLFPGTSLGSTSLVGTSTDVSTIRLFDFGDAVQISAPKTQPNNDQDHGTQIVLRSHRMKCDRR
jgi:hypothetical protein